jgi:hypothetical protein
MTVSREDGIILGFRNPGDETVGDPAGPMWATAAHTGATWWRPHRRKDQTVTDDMTRAWRFIEVGGPLSLPTTGNGDWYDQSGLMVTTQSFAMRSSRYLDTHGLPDEVLGHVARPRRTHRRRAGSPSLP